MKIYYVEENEVRYVLFEENGKLKICEPDVYGMVEGVDLWGENVVSELHKFYNNSLIENFEDLDLFQMNIEIEDIDGEFYYIIETE